MNPWQQLQNDLAAVLNRHCFDNLSNTPDFVLAKMVMGFLLAYSDATAENMRWHEWPSLSHKLGLDKPPEVV
jgi:hypothetical protein